MLRWVGLFSLFLKLFLMGYSQFLIQIKLAWQTASCVFYFPHLMTICIYKGLSIADRIYWFPSLSLCASPTFDMKRRSPAYRMRGRAWPCTSYRSGNPTVTWPRSGQTRGIPRHFWQGMLFNQISVYCIDCSTIREERVVGNSITQKYVNRNAPIHSERCNIITEKQHLPEYQQWWSPSLEKWLRQISCFLRFH